MVSGTLEVGSGPGPGAADGGEMASLRFELTCTACGHDNAPGTVLCYRCGQVMGKPVGASRPMALEAAPARGSSNREQPLPATAQESATGPMRTDYLGARHVDM